MEAFFEDKYDGMRAQVHCGDAGQPGRVAIYSRNREDVTESFPELEEAFAKVRPEQDGALIFDGEILGWDLEQARALPFAVLGQRIGRKRVSNGWRQQVPVVFMAFDLMYADGELLLERPLRERRNRLEAVVEELVERVVSPVMVDERARDSQTVLFAGAESEGVERLMISPSRLVESAEDIDRAYADARARANEGVMLKAAGSVYQPGRRGLAWVKLKRELATLDVVVTGAEFGHGKRAGILSDYTFAVRGAGGELLNVGKAYSGLTDAEIAEMSAWMMEHTLEDQGFFRTVEPLMVLEVAFNNIMRSGRHASGFALRFPRILRIRTDKPVNEIDTVERVEEIYQSQVDKPVESGNDSADSALTQRIVTAIYGCSAMFPRIWLYPQSSAKGALASANFPFSCCDCCLFCPLFSSPRTLHLTLRPFALCWTSRLSTGTAGTLRRSRLVTRTRRTFSSSVRRFRVATLRCWTPIARTTRTKEKMGTLSFSGA